MAEKDPEKEYDNLTDTIKFAFQSMLEKMWVYIPGIIESYDQATKRCTVRPAINIKLKDGGTVAPAAIKNVPVMWPSGGGFTILSPLPTGSPVEILFSQRGITQFKESFSQADPGNGVFAKEDAIVRAGFGAKSVTPATADGMAMQSEDGNNYLYIENGIVKVASTTKIINEAPEIEFNASTKIAFNTPLFDLSADMEIGGNISGPTVFGGEDSDTHGHEQGTDSDGDTQQKTNGPS
ncbi:MAG: hypothetical protein KAR40_13905 [Candidatus Sabulitectum sp.]|nr:hypothetical protein [Candidatus Sabulitectum sp.]